MFKLNVIYLQRIKARRDCGKTVTFWSITWLRMDAASTRTRPRLCEMPYCTGGRSTVQQRQSLHTLMFRCPPSI